MKIIHYIGSLGFGGDCKNLLRLTEAQSTWAKVAIWTYQTNPELHSILINNTVQVLAGNINYVDLLEKEKDPTIFFIHRNGRPNPQETSLLTALKAQAIPCFEYNTFARVDQATDDLWTGHCHLSRASLCQYAARKGVSVEELFRTGHRAIGYAVDRTKPIEIHERLAARQEFGLSENDLVLTRLLRPDLRKWDPLPVLGIRKAIEQGAAVKFIIQSPPASRIVWLQKMLGKRCHILSPSVDPQNLRKIFAAADCVVNCSAIGETFGLAMAEGMMLGLPVMVNATAKQDNAQVEFIQNGRGGWIANSVQDFADLLLQLQNNKTEFLVAGAIAQEQTLAWFETTVVEKRLRGFMIERLKAKSSVLAEKIPAVEEFDDTYILSDRWLQDWQSQDFAFQPLKKNVVDECQLFFLRMWDVVTYARQMGAAHLWMKLKERLSRGSLHRK
ncbi:MAG: glycosyltransferase [Candidatus Obscuribacterales bacterium]|nr:glycosyltransferase [Candidatus Obscuribacterales bacterium]